MRDAAFREGEIDESLAAVSRCWLKQCAASATAKAERAEATTWRVVTVKAGSAALHLREWCVSVRRGDEEVRSAAAWGEGSHGPERSASIKKSRKAVTFLGVFPLEG